jgi:hypothetical protein
VQDEILLPSGTRPLRASPKPDFSTALSPICNELIDTSHNMLQSALEESHMLRLLCLLIFTVCGACAQTLTCMFDFIGSGTIGTTTFTNAEVLITTVGFTANAIASTAAGSASLANDSASIVVYGVGTFHLSGPTGISSQLTPTDAAPGTSVNQAISFTVAGQPLVLLSAVTTSPWAMWNTYLGPPAFDQNSDGTFSLSPADGQLENWNSLPVITLDGYTINLYSTTGSIPVTFQALLSAGVPCPGTPNGDVSDVQAVVNEALGVEPATTDMNGDGIVSVVDVRAVTDAVLGCGATNLSQQVRRLR